MLKIRLPLFWHSAIAVGLVVLGGCDVIWGLQRAQVTTVDGGTGGTAGAGGSGGSGTACTAGALVACYSGPEGTEGVGQCKAGKAVCDAAGVPGACTNDVTPKPERCADAADENCDGHDCVENARLFGDISEQEPLAVAVDEHGNSYTVGRFKGSIKLDQVTLVETGVGGGNGFILALDPTGKALWGLALGGAGSVVSAVTLDTEGNLAIGGFVGGGPFGWGSSSIPTGLFVAELNTDGTPGWSTSLQAGSGSIVNDVAATTGGVLAAGAFYGSIDVGDGPISAKAGFMSDPIDGFVAFLRGSDGSGKAADGGWCKTFGDEWLDGARGVRADAGGNVFVAGTFNGTINLGGLDLTSSGGSDILVAKLSASGGLLWQKQFGDVSDQEVTGLAADSTGNVVLAGTFQGAIDFGGSMVKTDTSSLFAAAMYGTNGSVHWARAFGATGAVSAAIDDAGDTILAGAFTGTIDLGGVTLKASGTSLDVFVAKLASDGAHVWSKQFGDQKEQAARGVAALASGESVVVGVADGLTDFGTGSLKSAGSWDGFVARFGK